MKTDIKENPLQNNINTEYDIAIIGMSCRFPGAQNADEFWYNLANGVESIIRLSDEDILRSGVPASYLNNPNYVKASPILEDPGLFDARFFGFSPMEAKTMDPQHRILLELAYEALEDAGYDADRYGGHIGMFAGSAMNTYFIYSGLHAKYLDEYIPTLIGNDKDFLNTRISYKLGLKGPSITVQTACSTALVAVHLASQSLLSEESDMVLAGAISVRVPHKAGYICDGGGIVSSDGHIRAFDSKANGTVFGSGGGIVVLKRLADALEDGDTIHAIIKGSAINNDGSDKAGYTAPSVNSQAEAVIEALANAGVDAENISYMEAHGSGTPVGDPIEVLALTKAFRAFTERSDFCAIGSVKTNIGHLDAAAGIASLIKTVLALKHQKIPPSLHYSQPNPEIDFSSTPFYVNTRLVEWESKGPRRAGVMSTGMGGTNAHLVLEEFSGLESTDSSGVPNLLVLSAKNETALDSATNQLLEFIKSDATINMDDAAYTLQVGRKAFNHRKCVVCADREEAISLSQEIDKKKVFSSVLDESVQHPVIFLFPGIGDHYVGMAYDLYKNYDIFKNEVDQCAQILMSHLDIDIREILYPKDSKWQDKAKDQRIDLKKMLGKKTDEPVSASTAKLNQTIYAQPAQFTIEYALARFWNHLGIAPDAIVGHSMGEYVAACFAGVFSLEDALRLIAKRAKLVNDLPQGAMLAVMLPERELLPLLNEDLSISLINGPDLCVVAGLAVRVVEFENLLKEKSIIYRHVQNVHAFHSKMLDPIVADFEKEVRRVQLNKPRIPFTSNVTGKWISNNEATDPVYWAKHANHTARFSDALNNMWHYKNAILLEVGPGRTLGVLAMQHPERQNAEKPVVLSSLRQDYENQSDVEFLLHSIGKLWLSGGEINWENIHQRKSRRRISLPTYPFEKKIYWIEPQLSHASENVDAIHPKLALSVDDWFYAPSWEKAALPSNIENQRSEIHNKLWLVFVNEREAGIQIKEFLENNGADVVIVNLSQKYDYQNDGCYEINSAAPNDYIKLLRNLKNINEKPINIIHMGCLTLNESGNSENRIGHYQNTGFYSLLFLTQAFGELGISNAIKIGVMSNLMHQVTGKDILIPEKATILGPIGVIPKEYHNIKCFNVDLSGGDLPDNLSHDQLDNIVGEFAESSLYNVIAYRGEYRWVRKYDRLMLSDNSDKSNGGSVPEISRLRHQGVYLITGGTGGIGLAIAKYMARACQAKIVLTKKTKFPKKSKWNQVLANKEASGSILRILKEIFEIEKLGAEVEVCVSDAADKNHMQKIFAETKRKFGAIHGVIHAAGLINDGMIQAKTREVADSVIIPKVKGALIINELLKEYSIDFLVLFSSIASALAPHGQVDYSAANAFLDAFSAYSNSKNNFHTLTINWPGWKETGMLANLKPRPGLEKWKEDNLKKAISTKDGIEAFKKALNSEHNQIIVCPEDFNLLYQNATMPIDISTYISTGKGIIPKITGTVSTREVEQTISEIWSRVLGIDQIDVKDDFFELGGNSLTAIRLFAEIENIFGKKLPLATLYQAHTVEQLANLVKQDEWQPDWSSLVTIQPDGSNPPLFLIHGAEGNILLYWELASHLGPDQPVYGLQSRGLDGDLDIETRLEDMAANYIEEIKKLQPKGPYYLGGYCMGGGIAFEIAQQLRTQGQKVNMLALFETYNPLYWNYSNSSLFKIGHPLQNFIYHYENLLQASSSSKMKFFKKKATVQKNRIKVDIGIRLSKILHKLNLASLSNYPHINIGKIHDDAFLKYKPSIYPGRLTLFRPQKYFFGNNDPHFGWDGFAEEGLGVHTLPVSPRGMLVEPFVQNLADKLKKEIAVANSLTM